MTPGVGSEESDKAYRALIQALPPGITFLALHPNAPGDIETIVPPRAHFRTDEYRLLGNGRIAEWLQAAGIMPLGMRPLRDLYRVDREAPGHWPLAGDGVRATAPAAHRRPPR
jgi:hypothetical protein